jgi:hypothetical protein
LRDSVFRGIKHLKTLKISRNFPLVFLVKVGLKQSKTFGKEEGKLILNGLFCSHSKGKKMGSYISLSTNCIRIILKINVLPNRKHNAFALDRTFMNTGELKNNHYLFCR